MNLKKLLNKLLKLISLMGKNKQEWKISKEIA